MAANITEADVRQVAKLSRLTLSDAEVHEMVAKLSNVLGYVSKLNELDVTGVEPMAHAMPMSNVLRPDEPKPGLAVEKVLDNAPDQSPPFFKVPKVIGDDGGA